MLSDVKRGKMFGELTSYLFPSTVYIKELFYG